MERKDINVNIQDDRKCTPLIISCSVNATESVKLLLSHPDIDINHFDDDKMTALNWAIIRKNYKIINLFINHT